MAKFVINFVLLFIISFKSMPIIKLDYCLNYTNTGKKTQRFIVFE